MSDFRVKDEVVLTENSSAYPTLPVGSIGVIEEISRHNTVIVKFCNNLLRIHTDYISYQKFQVGEKVLIDRDSGHPPLWVGSMRPAIATEGTIEILGQDPESYGIVIGGFLYFFHATCLKKLQTINTQEKEMSTLPVIETKTFIMGQNSLEVSDEKIYEHIRALETEINHLESIENKPKKLQQKIEAKKADIKKLVDFCDQRE